VNKLGNRIGCVSMRFCYLTVPVRCRSFFLSTSADRMPQDSHVRVERLTASFTAECESDVQDRVPASGVVHGPVIRRSWRTSSRSCTLLFPRKRSSLIRSPTPAFIPVANVFDTHMRYAARAILTHSDGRALHRRDARTCRTWGRVWRGFDVPGEFLNTNRH
jgi:hypothetical protein